MTNRTLALIAALLIGSAASAGPASAQRSPAAAVQPVPYGATYDDGYVRFALQNFSEAVDGAPTDRGWNLHATARVVGTGIPDGSSLRFKLTQGAQELGTQACSLEVQRFDVVREWHKVGNCHDQAQRITVTGDVQVGVFFVDGGSSAETLIAQHSLQILTATHMRGNGEPDAASHYINHNGEVLRGILMPVPASQGGFDGQRPSGPENFLELTVVAASSDSNRRPGALRMVSSRNSLTCTVDGAPVAISSPQVRGREVVIESVTHSVGTDRREEQQIAAYQWIQYTLPLEWGSARNQDGPAINEHPGRWQCEIRQANQVIRGFAFTVNADGSLAAHAEEAAGFTLGLGAHLVDVTVPNSETFETRVDPDSVRRLGIGYGHLLATPAGQALIAALPTLGTAFLPQPAAPAARAPRGRRGR